MRKLSKRGADVKGVEPLKTAPAASAIGSHISMLVIAWLVVMQVLRKLRRHTLETNTRERRIETRASNWASGGLTAFVLTFAVIFTFSRLYQLGWAKRMTIPNLLLFTLIAPGLLEYATTGLSY